MIYPKDIVDFVKQDAELTNKFPHVAQIESANTTHLQTRELNFAFEEYMLNKGHIHSRPIRKYLHFISSTYDIFNEIYQYFPKENPQSTHKDDESAVGTAPWELLHHALYLYVLDSWGVEGDVMECGTFKGYSACCLSWVCDYLDKQLIVADSFEGLPENQTDPYYKKGDFLGRIDEVRSNIEDFGKIERVQFIKGFYETSLKGFNRKLCMLWIDVDLYESATDILKNVFNFISKSGVIISHELFEDRDFADYQLKKTIGPAKALSLYLTNNDISYKAMPLENGSGLVILCNESEQLLFSKRHGQFLRDHCRQSDIVLKEQHEKNSQDILYWKNEVEKLLNIYRSTLDYKIKRAIKKTLRKFGLYDG